MLSLPTHIEHDGVEYPINTHYSIALECFSLINDNTVSDTERSVGVITMLFGVDIPIDDKSLHKARKYLEVGMDGDDGDSSEPTVDFTQHAEYIYASFKQQYPTVPLEDLHYWEFISLFKGLSNETVMGRIQELLSTEPSEMDDPKQRRDLIKAQNKFKVKTPKDIDREVYEKKKEDEFMDKLLGRGG